MALRILARLAFVFATLIVGCHAATIPGVAQPVQPPAAVLPPEAPGEAPDPGIERALASTLRLYNLDGRGICTAVAISPTRIVTAHHCIVAGMITDDELEVLSMLYPRLDVELEGMRGAPIRYSVRDVPAAFTARIVAWDIANDVAILEASRLPSFVPVNGAKLRVGQEVFHVGHPGGIAYSYTHGYVSHLCDREEDESDAPIGECFTRVDISIAGGSSGGGLFNRAGELVGVTSAGYNRIALGRFTSPAALAGIVRL